MGYLIKGGMMTMNEFNKEIFLEESKNMFQDILDKIFTVGIYAPEFTDILGDVINTQFNKYRGYTEIIIKAAAYKAEDLENWYEFDEENFSDYFDEHCIIKNYREALAYYSLNHLFLEKYEKYFDDIIEREFN